MGILARFALTIGAATPFRSRNNVHACLLGEENRNWKRLV